VATVGDIAAFRASDALYEQARAQELQAISQESLARETARTNEILAEAQDARNRELQRQFEENKQEVKREKFAKNLLVKTELLFETLNYDNINLELLAEFIAKMTSLLNFSKNNGLLEDFFQDVEDIRYAHKILNEANIQSSKAKSLYKQMQEDKLEEEILYWLKNLGNIYLTNLEEDQMLMPTAELFSAYWFIHNSTKLLRARYQNEEFNSVLESAIEVTENYIRVLEKKEEGEKKEYTISHAKLLFSSFEDFRQILLRGVFEWREVGRLQELLKQSETKRIKLEKVKSEILVEKSDDYLRLQEAELELENFLLTFSLVPNFLRRRRIKRKIYAIKAKLGDKMEVIDADLIRLTSEEILIRADYENKLKKMEKEFKHNVKNLEKQFKSCFLHVPEFKSEDLGGIENLVSNRTFEYVIILKFVKQRFPWSFTKEDIADSYSRFSLEQLFDLGSKRHFKK